ncbi:hypothetical protein NQ317_010688 [Molorchus minor]|uniref:Uncharacterized protein n=1 Tax=Molorchus minor TaxID=1323400 RepID=A0ABQ9K7D5_9CUCU|nr:hypothetical protein NQ317_010688 [Molorchus minor]
MKTILMFLVILRLCGFNRTEHLHITSLMFGVILVTFFLDAAPDWETRAYCYVNAETAVNHSEGDVPPPTPNRNEQLQLAGSHGCLVSDYRIRVPDNELSTFYEFVSRISNEN